MALGQNQAMPSNQFMEHDSVSNKRWSYLGQQTPEMATSGNGAFHHEADGTPPRGYAGLRSTSQRSSISSGSVAGSSIGESDVNEGNPFANVRLRKAPVVNDRSAPVIR